MSEQIKISEFPKLEQAQGTLYIPVVQDSGNGTYTNYIIRANGLIESLESFNSDEYYTKTQIINALFDKQTYLATVYASSDQCPDISGGHYNFITKQFVPPINWEISSEGLNSPLWVSNRIFYADGRESQWSLPIRVILSEEEILNSIPAVNASQVAIYKSSEEKPNKPEGGVYDFTLVDNKFVGMTSVPYGWKLDMEGLNGTIWVSYNSFNSNGYSSGWTSPIKFVDIDGILNRAETNANIAAANALKTAKEDLEVVKQNLQNQLNQTVVQLNQAKLQLAQAEKLLANVNGISNYASEEIDSLKGLINQQARSLNGINSTVTQLQRVVNAQEGFIEDYGEVIDVANKSVNKVKSTLDAVNATITQQASHVNELAGTVTEVSQVLDAVNGSIKTMATKSDLQNVQAAAIEVASNRITQEVSSLQKNLDDTIQSVKNAKLELSDDEIRSAVSSAIAKDNTIRTAVSEIIQKDNTIGLTVAEEVKNNLATESARATILAYITETDDNGNLSLKSNIELTADNIALNGQVFANQIAAKGLNVDNQTIIFGKEDLDDGGNTLMILGADTENQSIFYKDCSASLAGGLLHWEKGSDGKFKLTVAGNIGAEGSTIGGWTMGNNYLYSSKDNKILQINPTSGIQCVTTDTIPKIMWSLNTDGSASFGGNNLLLKSDGSIEMTGKISATSGSIGDWSIDSKKLTSYNANRPANHIEIDPTIGIYAADGAKQNYWTFKTDGTFKLGTGDKYIERNSDGNIIFGAGVTMSFAKPQSLYTLYNSSAINPGAPSRTSWSTSGWTLTMNSTSVWMSTKTSTSLEEGNWSDPVKIKGNDGVNGKDGTNGSDGTSVKILGSKTYTQIQAITGANIGDGYICTDGGSTRLGHLFTWSGTNWIDCGEIKGPKGDDGTVISWQGASDVAPSNPQPGWTYFNNLDKTSYMYFSPGGWQEIAKSGSDGQKGSDGAYITGVETEYIASTAQPSASASGQKTIPTASKDALYIWERYSYTFNTGGSSKSQWTKNQAISNLGSYVTWIGADGIYSGTIAANKLVVGGTGSDAAKYMFTVDGYNVYLGEGVSLKSANWNINSDGTFNLGKNNNGISLDTTGKVTLGSNVVLSWSNLDSTAQQKLKGDKGDTGAQGPQGAKGEDGTSIKLKANASQCEAIGDGYVDANGHLQMLTNTSPKTFQDCGSIKGPQGDSGKSITSATTEYLWSTATNVTNSTSGWSTVLGTGTGNLWERTKYTWSSGNPTYSTPQQNDVVAKLGTFTTHISNTGIYTGTLAAEQLVIGSKVTNGETTSLFSVSNGIVTADALSVKKINGMDVSQMFTGANTIAGGTIGGWTATSNALYNGTKSMTSTTAGTYLGTAGIRNYKDSTHYVDIKNGTLTANSVDLSGKITATDGSIGGWNIQSNSISSTTYENEETMFSTSYGLTLNNDSTNLGIEISKYFKELTGPDAYEFTKESCVLNKSGFNIIIESGDEISSSSTCSTQLNLDGSGFFANGNCEWDKSGNFIIKSNPYYIDANPKFNPLGGYYIQYKTSIDESSGLTIASKILRKLGNMGYTDVTSTFSWNLATIEIKPDISPSYGRFKSELSQYSLKFIEGYIDESSPGGVSTYGYYGATVNGDFINSSDIRYKNIISSEDCLTLDAIANAPYFKFTWNDRDDQSIHIGSSAQYWQSVCPESVIESNGRLALNYTSLGLGSAITIARKVREQEYTIKNLMSRIEALEAQLANR